MLSDAGAQAIVDALLSLARTMLSDGRKFLLGAEPCLADCALYNPVWFIQSQLGGGRVDESQFSHGSSEQRVRWFKRALLAPRYESYAFPHFNLARVYEKRHRYLDAVRHYSLALEQQPGFAEANTALRRLQSLLN